MTGCANNAAACRRSWWAICSILAALHFLGQLIAALALAVAHVFLGVDHLGLAQQRCNLRLQLGLGIENSLTAQCLMFGGIGLDLGAIEGHVAQAHQARLLTQPQHLHKLARQCIEMNEAEITDPAVVRLLIAGEHAEGQILVARSLNLAGGDDAKQ
jgi:hypothetical protein